MHLYVLEILGKASSRGVNLIVVVIYMLEL